MNKCCVQMMLGVVGSLFEQSIKKLTRKDEDEDCWLIIHILSQTNKVSNFIRSLY